MRSPDPVVAALDVVAAADPVQYRGVLAMIGMIGIPFWFLLLGGTWLRHDRSSTEYAQGVAAFWGAVVTAAARQQSGRVGGVRYRTAARLAWSLCALARS